MPPRDVCTCYGRFSVCPACLADTQAQAPAQPETRGRRATTQAAVRAAMQPPGSWHRAPDLAVVVQRVPEQIHTLLHTWWARGVVARQGTRGHYLYTLTEEE